MASIELDRVSKTFRHDRQLVQALNSVELQVSAGELLTVVGPSGSGKTTLLRLIAGLDAPTEGDIRIAGKSMKGVSPRDRQVAMVFQSGALFPHLTVRDNIALGLKLRNVLRQERESRVKEALDRLRLQDCASRFPPDLSTGQRQRVALARAIVRRPGIFLLDEPLANLDSPMRAELRSEILRLRAQLKSTMIYVTHDQAEALGLGERVAVLREGRLEQVGEPELLYRRPVSMFVAGFIGAMNFVSGNLLEERRALFFRESTGGPAGFLVSVNSIHQKQLQRFAGRPIILGVRPEDVVALREVTERDSFRGTIENVEYHGPNLLMRVKTAANTLILRSPTQAGIKPGDEIAIQVPANAVIFFDPQTGLRLTD